MIGSQAANLFAKGQMPLQFKLLCHFLLFVRPVAWAAL